MVGMFKHNLWNIQGNHQKSEGLLTYSGTHIWNFTLSHIETDCAIRTFKKLYKITCEFERSFVV